jgi:hypothetical protein
LDIKHKILHKANLTIVSPSKWLAKEAKKSSLFKDKEIIVIPNGVDTKIFKPRKNAKEKFNINKKSVVLSFGVVNHDEKRKGFSKLYKALKIVKKEIKDIEIVGIVFGNNSSNLPIKTLNVGYVKNEKDLSYIYSASDIFILPSLEDNLPNVILESMACKTPVIAFDTGGARDIINDSNGKIVPKGDEKKLAKAIINMIRDKQKRNQKAKKALKTISKHYTIKHQAKRYKKLYEDLLSQKFKYTNADIEIDKKIDSILGYVTRQNKTNKNLSFSKNFNQFYAWIEELKQKNYKYVVYGNGTIGKTIQALISDKIIGYVDINDTKNHPLKLKQMQFDKIIISVLGREEEILRYLIKELKISQEKIIYFNSL